MCQRTFFENFQHFCDSGDNRLTASKNAKRHSEPIQAERLKQHDQTFYEKIAQF
jgi:hypothetical protein